jgi:hypothetical protein
MVVGFDLNGDGFGSAVGFGFDGEGFGLWWIQWQL